MLTASVNALALMRFGGGHGGGFGLVLLGLAAFGAVVWTLMQSHTKESGKS
jgi:hypothetical protein